MNFDGPRNGSKEDGKREKERLPLTALWQNEGRHAFLHHLNALFGYEPILIIEKRPMRF